MQTPVKKLLALLFVLLLLTGCALPRPGTQPTETVPSGSRLQIHYIDVGQADCALLECDGHYMLIDGGNVADSSLVVSYLQKQGVQQLDAVVCTHAHEDHVGGLPGVLAVFPVQALYAPTRTYASACFDDFMYYADQQRLTVQLPAPGDEIPLGRARVTVLGPTKSYSDTNNTSIVLLVRYGETTFLFTGDMETQAENDMLDYWGEDYDFHADVLKVGHHGSETSTGYRFLRAVSPTWGVISVGTGNSYGHPHEAPLSRLHDADVTLLRTDTLGTVIATSDGKTVSFRWEKQSQQPEDPTQSQPRQWIGNTRSGVLHLPGCASLPGADNRIIFDDYDEAIAAGYRPCSRCMG